MFSDGDMIYVVKTREKGMVVYCNPFTKRITVDLENSGKKEFWESEVEMDFTEGKYANY